MNILIDIGHPTHPHLFKNLVRLLQKNGHKILFTLRDREATAYLLKKYNLDYILIGKVKKELAGKALGLVEFTLRLLEISRKFKPALFLSDGSIYAAIASKIVNKPHISLEDTGNLEQIMLYKPFTDVILSPESLALDLGKKHIKYRSYHEMAYLHSRYFSPDKNILAIMGVGPTEKFVIARFGQKTATHDFGYRGMPLEYKIKCVNEFEKYAKIFISSEINLHPYLERYRIKIPLEKMHDAIYYSALVFSEGAKIASEASLLGVPAIYVNFAKCDYILEQKKKYGTIFDFGISYTEYEMAIRKGKEILKDIAVKEKQGLIREKILRDNIDPTSFMVWFIENYPVSQRVMKTNPEYQLNFR
jgi:predicted glycosyltransferase